jgi:hypothetical protein
LVAPAERPEAEAAADTFDPHEAVTQGHPLRLTGRCGTGPGLQTVVKR